MVIRDDTIDGVSDVRIMRRAVGDRPQRLTRYHDYGKRLFRGVDCWHGRRKDCGDDGDNEECAQGRKTRKSQGRFLRGSVAGGSKSQPTATDGTTPRTAERGT